MKKNTQNIMVKEKIKNLERKSIKSWVIFINGDYGSGKTTIIKEQRKILKKSNYKVSPIINAPGMIEPELEITKKNFLQRVHPAWYNVWQILKFLRFTLSIAIAFISFDWVINRFNLLNNIYKLTWVGSGIFVVLLLLIFNKKFFLNFKFIGKNKIHKKIIIFDDFDRLTISELSTCLNLIDWLKDENKYNFIITGNQKLFANQYSKLITGLPMIESEKIFLGGNKLTDKICQNEIKVRSLQ